MALVVGAFTGAMLLVSGYAVVLSLEGSGALQFAFYVLLAFALLALVLPVAQPPIWFALRLLRVPDWLASTLAGAAAFAVLHFVLSILWNSGYGTGELDVAQLLAWSLVGGIAGFVIWRVAFLEVT